MRRFEFSVVICADAIRLGVLLFSRNLCLKNVFLYLQLRRLLWRICVRDLNLHLNVLYYYFWRWLRGARRPVFCRRRLFRSIGARLVVIRFGLLDGRPGRRRVDSALEQICEEVGQPGGRSQTEEDDGCDDQGNADDCHGGVYWRTSVGLLAGANKGDLALSQASSRVEDNLV